MDELTQDWLDTFAESKASGECLADSVFWRLAVDVLPLGVDPEHPEVQAALDDIRASIRERNCNGPNASSI